ncbi:unnamed protein product, partial [Closterium sp. NIES-54]
MHHITREGEASPEEEPWETSNKESAEGDGPNPELEVDDADGGHDNEEPGAGIEYAKPAQADTAKGASQEVAEGSRSGRWELRGSNADRQEVHDAERSRQQERQERDVGADAVGMQGERGRGKVELLRVTEEEARHWERAPGIPHSLDKRQTREGWVGDGTRLPERQLMRKGGWEGEPSIPNGYWRQEERRKEGPSSPGRHGQRQGERSGEALSSGPPEQWERRIGGGFRSPHARQQQSGEGGRDRHSPEGRRHQRRGEAWSPSPERQRQRKTSAAGWRDARVSLARLKARAEEWRGLRERRGDSSWNQQESKTGRGSLAYGAEQAREAREGPARFSGDQRAGPTLKNYLMQVGIVKYRCDRQGMDPIDFFLSLPNTLEGEAETLYRMRMDELLWRAGRYGEEPTEAFLERLQRQFPGHTAERIREFQGPKRAYQAVGELLTGEQQAEEQGGIEGLMGGPRMRWMDEPKRHSDWQQPIHLVELFGGIGAGLSAVIRSGIAVRKWTYVEKEPVVRKMVEHHAWKLQAEFPDLLSGRVVQEAMGGAVHDVQHRKCFAFTMQELGRCKVKEMELKLSSTEPMFHRKRKMPHGDEEICKEKIKELEEVGLIRRSESKYATPTVVAARRDRTGEVLSRRMCGDYMALNKITIADRYPIPMAEEIFDKLAEGVFFMTLDLRQGNASAVFQRVMDSVLRGVECAACYIDDVVIFSTTKKQHLQDVERTLTAIEAAGLTCHPKKCRWGEQTVLYLGYEVKGWQIGIQQAKVEVLDRLREPKDKSGLRAVLGFLSYYRRFVPNFSKRATVLNGLLREDKAWEWGEAQKGARQDLMTAVKTAMLLKLPTADQPFTLYTDWRSQGMGGILCQEVEGEEKVVAYASRSCNLAEAQYSSYIGEGLAAAWAVGHFRVYLQGREFTLVTDHQPLTWLMTTPGLTGRNAR